jgi:hypothetical protein
MTWYKAREWCTERGMQLAMLKTLSQVEAVSKELTSRGHSKKKSENSDLRLKFQLFVLLQIIMNPGCLLRTEAGHRMDSSSGWMARQWTKPLG